MNRRKLLKIAAMTIATSSWTFGVSNTMAARNKPIVIAHRGASGYLPEHTLPAKAMAHAMGADFIEQDVVLSADNVPMVIHDLTLDATTNVADVFQSRSRDNGKHYVADFTFSELQQLAVHERANANGDAKYKNRFPNQFQLFRLHTLEQELALIQGLNRSTGRDTGVYVELKSPAWHSSEGKDVASIVLSVLEKFGYDSNPSRVYLQSFDQQALSKLKEKTSIPLVQLIGENNWWPDENTDYDYLKTAKGIQEIATYAAGIGPWIGQLQLGTGKQSAMVRDAHQAGLAVHPYTVRDDRLPKNMPDMDALLHALLEVQGVDGVFTDFPDLVRRFVDQL